MAYYDALVAKWNTLSGTTQSKLSQINALTVTLPSTKARLTPSQILNACVFADLAALTSLQLQQLSCLLSGDTVDASAGTPIRLGIQTLFSGKTTTLANLAALVAPYDAPTMAWWQATVAQGGGGLSSPVSQGDLTAAGNLT